nr:MAG TPA: hypothetical protein [Bacteriophage sp.]
MESYTSKNQYIDRNEKKNDEDFDFNQERIRCRSI